MKKSIRVLKVFCALFLLMLLCSTWFVLYCAITGYESRTLWLGYFLGFAIYTLWGDTSIIVVVVMNFITTLFLLKMIIPMFSLPKLHHSHWGSHIYISRLSF